MCPSSFVCDEAKIQHNILPQWKNFVKSVRKQYGNPDPHAFFKLFITIVHEEKKHGIVSHKLVWF